MANENGSIDYEAVFQKAVREGVIKGLEEAVRAGSRGMAVFKSSLRDSMKEAVLGMAGSVLGGKLGLGGAAGGKGGVGGFISKFLGGGSGGILGKMGGLGGMGGVLGGVDFAKSLYDAYKGGPKAELSGVKPIFAPSIRNIGGGLDSLFSSAEFSQAAFSSRNIGGGLLSNAASARVNQEVTVNIKPSREFDAIAEDRMVTTSRYNSIGGVPRRTNFDHG